MVRQAQPKNSRCASFNPTLDRPGIRHCSSAVCGCFGRKASLLESLPSECCCVSGLEGQEMATHHEQAFHAQPIIRTVFHFAHEHVQVCKNYRRHLSKLTISL